MGPTNTVAVALSECVTEWVVARSQRTGLPSTMTVMLASGADTIRLIRNREPSAFTSYSYAREAPTIRMCDQPDLKERRRCPDSRRRARRERGGHQAAVRREEIHLAAVGSPSRIATPSERYRIRCPGSGKLVTSISIRPERSEAYAIQPASLDTLASNNLRAISQK